MPRQSRARIGIPRGTGKTVLMNSAATSTPVIVAEQTERLPQLLKDIWSFRELFWTFLERDLKVRYKQTALGVVWVILQPLFMSGAFTVVFGKIIGMETEGLPPTRFFLAANV